MLTLDQKKKIFRTYPLDEYETLKGERVNYKYKNKVVVIELTHTGNGYVWGRDIAEYSKKYDVDERGWIKIKAFTEEEIRLLLNEVLKYRDKIS
ncbi:hypothetical protein OR571_09085 [Psychrobacillus sp. NEAU-3TGS]|uniref:hypothetical protein n=1 Tax=Psychrobacillus sp. NEAU-3TGS TaxID=2995412 RepID=UPI0024970595|nr:hypothetical protein [Psychrobacillus sp. NEAU-3TGS]MDI2587252.1 hypothetical protein [Psychrobacillus sp. NEAU-3TGS]